MNWKILSMLVLGVLLLAHAPDARAQSSCCQLPEGCFGDETGINDAACTADGGQPTSGLCNPDTGLCGGTTVCCSCDEPKCENVTAAECKNSLFGVPEQNAMCDPEVGCVSVCRDSCAEGQTVCDGECVDTQTDAANCGGCGKRCPIEFGARCMSGSCCTVGSTNCNGQCANLDNDPENCGACGVRCGAGEKCDNGSCVPECPPPMTQCGNECVDTSSDPNNCGACGNVCVLSPILGISGFVDPCCTSGSCGASPFIGSGCEPLP